MARSSSGSSSVISQALITLAQRGQAAPLVSTLHRLLLRALKARSVPAADAQDLAQECTLRLLKVFCAGAVAPGCWDAYAYRTAARAAGSFFKARRFEALAGDEALEVEDEAPPAEELLARNERRQLMRNALGRLSAADRELLVRHYFDGEPLGVFMAGASPEAIYKRHERAKARLAAQLRRKMAA